MLKKELGLDEEDIIDLPILFKVIEEEEEEKKSIPRVAAYYPDMVQHIIKNLLKVHSHFDNLLILYMEN